MIFGIKQKKVKFQIQHFLLKPLKMLLVIFLFSLALVIFPSYYFVYFLLFYYITLLYFLFLPGEFIYNNIGNHEGVPVNSYPLPPLSSWLYDAVIIFLTFNFILFYIKPLFS